MNHACALSWLVLVQLQPSAPLDIQVLGWMQGRWLSQSGQGWTEEQWSLQGRSLLGVSRSMHGHASTSLELLLLEPDQGDWILRLRMFGPGLDKALRAKDEPLRLKLVEADRAHFKCEGLGPETGTTLVYTLKSPDTLHARISKTRDGKVIWSEEFLFRKVP